MSRPKPLARPATTLLPVAHEPPKNLADANSRLQVLRHNMRVSGFLFAHWVQWVRRHETYLEAHDSMEAWWFALFSDLSVNTMYRVLRFADSVPGEIAATYDAAKIDAGARLLPKNRRGERLITKEGLEAITVKALRDGHTVAVRFKDATVDELEAEVARRRKRSLPDASEALVNAESRFDRRFGAGVTRVAEVRKQRQGKKHVLVITVAEDRLDEFEELFR